MRALQKLPTSFRAKVLLAIAASLRSNIDFILAENKKDLDQAAQTALDANLLARLKLTSAKIETLATGMEQIAAQVSLRSKHLPMFLRVPTIFLTFECSFILFTSFRLLFLFSLSFTNPVGRSFE